VPILVCKLSGNATYNRGLACDRGRDQAVPGNFDPHGIFRAGAPKGERGGDEVTSIWQLGGENSVSRRNDSQGGWRGEMWEVFRLSRAVRRAALGGIAALRVVGRPRRGRVDGCRCEKKVERRRTWG